MKLKLIAIIVGSILIMPACKNHNTKNNTDMSEKNNNALFPKGNKVPKEWFSGEVYLQPLLAKDKNNDFALGSVTFEPKARTIWHKHPKGQVLIVTEGIGWYQEKGKPARAIKKGDIINCPENVEHWHGASANNRMVHIAITNYKGDENVVWLKPVTDEEYDAVNKN